MIRNCCMLVAGLLLHTQIFAQDKTAASRTGEDYTLSNGAVEAVFSGSGSFDIEKLVLSGKQVVGAGKNETPWILIYMPFTAGCKSAMTPGPKLWCSRGS